MCIPMDIVRCMGVNLGEDVHRAVKKHKGSRLELCRIMTCGDMRTHKATGRLCSKRCGYVGSGEESVCSQAMTYSARMDLC